MSEPTWRLLEGDALAILPTLESGSVDAVITDPPYALTEPRAVDGFGSMQRRGGVRTDDEKLRRKGGFMGKAWDAELPGVPFWQAILATVKPGGYMLAFGGTRTYHRLAVAIEDAGWEIRDCLMWVYGSGFPKGQACLKPAWEPILLARKPGRKVLPLNVDECRVPTSGESNPSIARRQGKPAGRPGEYGDTIVNRITPERYAEARPGEADGRWPANLVHDGSDEVMEAFERFGESESSGGTRGGHLGGNGKYGEFPDMVRANAGGLGDRGSAARFFYCAKADRSERGEGNTHPTVKPLALMRWLVRLVARAGETVFDPFAGSGTTLLAATLEGRNSIGIERDPGYCEIIRKRMAGEEAKCPLFTAVPKPPSTTPSLFGEDAQ